MTNTAVSLSGKTTVIVGKDEAVIRFKNGLEMITTARLFDDYLVMPSVKGPHQIVLMFSTETGRRTSSNIADMIEWVTDIIGIPPEAKPPIGMS